MAKVTGVKFFVADKVAVGSFESVNPGVEFSVELDDGEQPEDVANAMQDRVGLMWEKALCQRLYVKIEQHHNLQGPPLDPWAIRLYNQLVAKHYGNTGA